ncbi:hypothetical protein [Pyxidicoccus trucidator]|uniref:hypothetical protein n=1 Tax=Pyxidicoccus trucidator TaxID=2709662 RepID=UPI0013DBD7FE|nr:hypothetical protein [Pyxidicoccus trucidator]
MKVLWCWRCKADVPMLDEEEFSRVWPLYVEGMQSIKAIRLAEDEALSRDMVKAGLAKASAEFERLTGVPETSIDAVSHHRVSRFGPPCATCGKPLRTPQARHCAACGTPR